MIHFLSPARHVATRHRPRFDSLEGRIALTGDGSSSETQPLTPPGGTTLDVGSLSQEGPLSIHLIDPAPGSVLSVSPLSLVLEFNRPIFPDTVDSDVVVMQTDSEGNPKGYAAPNELTVDSSATRLIVSLPETLKPGRYQIAVFGTSSIMDIDGNYLTDGTNNLVVDQFDVAVPGVTLAEATDLGNPGPIPMETPATTLDFQSNPYAVSLYRIHLDPGHFWRVGLDVSAQRDGGTLDTALALFDDQGRPIATDEVGRKDAPNDPYLFAGLDPGTYYIGVSGVNNLPGPKGGYDPATGSAGSVPQSQDAGAFTLHVVADPVDTPPQLVVFAVDHADTLTPVPTGLTLGFSRAISLTSQSGDLAPILSKSIEVRDQNGLSWPVRISDYHESEAKISYLFDEFLPPGHYIVHLPGQGGLVDLAGLSPIADGQPSGILGQFDVPASEGSSDPLDLGALLPRAASDGVEFDVMLSEGLTASYRLVVTVPGMYKFQAQSNGDSPSIQAIGPGLDRTLSLEGSNDTLLSPGVYSIVFQAPPTGTLNVHSFFHLASSDIEIVLANGVGQGPALSLRLISFARVNPSPPPIAPTPVDPNASPTPLPATLPHADSGAPGEVAASSTRSASGSSNGELPSPASAMSPTPPAPAPTLADPKPLPTPPSAQPAPADSGARREDSAVSARSASGPSNSGMPSTAPVVTISLLGLGNDLVGRPLVEARGPEYTAPGPVPGSDSQASIGAARGRSVNSLRPEPTRFLTDPPRLPEIILAEEPATALAQAGAIVIDVERAIETVASLRQWAIRQERSVAAWAESWWNEGPDFGSRDTLIAHSISAHGPVQAGINSSPASPVRDDKWADAPRQGAKFLSPPIVVLTVAAVAQACRHYVHWWKFRRRSGPGQALKDPAPGSSLDRPIPLGRIIPWDRATATGRPPFRRSRAS